MNCAYKIISNEIKDDDLIDKIYSVTSEIESCYPAHKEWFYNKFLPGLKTKTRTIVYCEADEEIAGVLFLKHTSDEKKICTIFVAEKFRSNKIGTGLLGYSFDILKTKKPHITFSQEKLKFFEKIIQKYNWSLVAEKQDLYKKGQKEYIYNEQ